MLKKIIHTKLRKYKKIEKFVINNIPIFKLRSFLPYTFQKYNFPTEINSWYEIWKYLDSQQEFRVGECFKKLNYLSIDEMNAIESIGKKYSKYSRYFKRITIPIGINGMMSNISTIRTLLSFKKKKLSILEIGPGSGMLGLLANHFKIKYTAFDISCAFSVHIMSLYSFLFKKNFKDYALAPLNSKGIIDDKQYPLTFIPWWQFLNFDFKLPKYDFIIMNACFFEIDKKAIHFILNRLGSINQRQNILVDDWGSKKYTNISDEEALIIEKSFNIKKEKINYSKDFFIPNTQCHFSYILKNKNTNFNEFKKNLEKRLGFDLKKDVKIIEKKNIFIRILNFIIRHIRPGRAKHNFNQPKVLGYDSVVENNELKKNTANKISFNEFKLRIKKIEHRNGKPCFTEDELYGYEINSSEHA